MKPVPAYPAISPFERGSFGWAMDQCAAGNDVRRMDWPIEVSGSYETGKNTVAIWHVYVCNESAGTKCSGFSSGACGADNDEYIGLGVDSMGYSPTDDDKVALDWQTVDQVTQEQIAHLDANRWPHFPSYYSPEELRHEQRAGNLTAALIVIMAIVVMVGVMLIFRG